MKKTVVFFLLVVLPLCVQAETLVGGADPWPPFVDPSAPGGGVCVEIVSAALKTQGYAFDMKSVPWARAIANVKDGKYDILPNTWMTEDRKTFLAYSEPYLTNDIKFIKRKGDPFEYSGLDSLAGKTVATIRGYGYGDAFMKATHFTREESSKLILSIKKLVAGRVDLSIEDEIVARSVIAKEAPELMDKIEFCKTPLSSNKLYITSGLKNPRHAEIIAAFNKGLSAIKADGTFAEIMKRNNLE